MATQNVPTIDKPQPTGRTAVDEGQGAIPAFAERASESVSELYRGVKARAIAKETELEDYVKVHPVKSVLVAAGIGAGVGVVLGVLLARR